MPEDINAIRESLGRVAADKARLHQAANRLNAGLVEVIKELETLRDHYETGRRMAPRIQRVIDTAYAEYRAAGFGTDEGQPAAPAEEAKADELPEGVG